ncbi:Protein of unknown function [Fervidobacterium changbaicum]|uniref:DUF3800 domain-containing protein n=1 Tax=Fervidobacterium changbaicum TaxID=310769 RepID=A0ABX5QTN5_9BACT|nr:DUF3800 domain-containing protein [Fervidobacterium changbaicum]QAV33773.1 DUF3800 domain-containing protein [Fervidobacterium changbaicum]SDH32891.1 Protein of unknown function [Fervidobacterium changbaicum]
MATFFVFSDESGSYKEIRGDKFVKKTPFYVRASLIMDSNDWLQLKDEFYKLKESYQIPIGIEIKWSDMWILKKHQEKGEPLKSKNLLSLEDIPVDHLLKFVIESLSLLSKCRFCKIF